MWMLQIMMVTEMIGGKGLRNSEGQMRNWPYRLSLVSRRIRFKRVSEPDKSMKMVDVARASSHASRTGSTMKPTGSLELGAAGIAGADKHLKEYLSPMAHDIAPRVL
jgi:hypothetical protein